MDANPGTLSTCMEIVVHAMPTSDRPDDVLRTFRDDFCRLVGERFAGVIWQSGRAPELYRSDGHTLRGVFDPTENNIDEEWAVVALCVEVSERHGRDVAVRLSDGEGEFLLIECANVLPRWVEGEHTGRGRVWLFAGSFHLIPPPRTPREITVFPGITPPPIEACLALLADASLDTRADTRFHECIWERIETVSCARRHGRVPVPHTHHACLMLPQRVAQVVLAEPQLVAAAVRVLCDRDPIDMRACRAPTAVAPLTPLVPVRVAFNRMLFVQLSSERLGAPKTFGMPPDSPEYMAAWELGIKLACGFEILLASQYKSKKKGSPGDGGEEARSSMPSGAAWDKYVTLLRASGYFRGEPEGTVLYRELWRAAVEHYGRTVEDESSVTSTPDALTWREVANARARELFGRTGEIAEVAGDREGRPSDDDDLAWLEVTPTGLEEMLERHRQSEMTEKDLIDGDEEEEEEEKEKEVKDGRMMAQSMDRLKGFLSGVSEFSGVEVAAEEGEGSGDVSFDFDGMMASLKGPFVNGNSEEEDEDEGELVMKEQVGDADTQEYYSAMDEQLRDSTLQESFASATTAASTTTDSADDRTPVDIDLNMLSSLLESYSSQAGLPGPTSNILGMLGINMTEKK